MMRVCALVLALSSLITRNMNNNYKLQGRTKKNLFTFGNHVIIMEGIFLDCNGRMKQ